MKFCRFTPSNQQKASESDANGSPLTGLLQNSVVHEITGSFLGEWQGTGRTWAVDAVRLLAPVTPSKIVCVGRNYAEHAAELGNAVPKEPLIFLKPPSSVIGPGDAIHLPRISKRVDHEGELAAVIGRRCFQIRSADDASKYVAGYTCVNDVTARDLQKSDVASPFSRSKCFDTFCPIGPVVETEFDLAAAELETRVNGERRQNGRPAEMLFSVDVIIRWITQVMTLLPGDVVALGTPPGVGPLNAGDAVEVEVSGIGRLRNPVSAPESQQVRIPS